MTVPVFPEFKQVTASNEHPAGKVFKLDEREGKDTVYLETDEGALFGLLKLRESEKWISLAGKPGEGNIRRAMREIAKVGDHKSYQASIEDSVKKTEMDRREYRVAEAQKTHLMSHSAPDRSEGMQNASFVGGMFPGIYEDGEHYVAGKPAGNELLDLLEKIKSSPDEMITIYRAVPGDVKHINLGDWCTLTKEYAQIHMESSGDESWHILSRRVRADDVMTDGNSLMEWGFCPESYVREQSVLVPALTEVIEAYQGDLSTNQLLKKVLDEATFQGFDINSINSGVVSDVLDKFSGTSASPTVVSKTITRTLLQEVDARAFQEQPGAALDLDLPAKEDPKVSSLTRSF